MCVCVCVCVCVCADQNTTMSLSVDSPGVGHLTFCDSLDVRQLSLQANTSNSTYGRRPGGQVARSSSTHRELRSVVDTEGISKSRSQTLIPGARSSKSSVPSHILTETWSSSVTIGSVSSHSSLDVCASSVHADDYLESNSPGWAITNSAPRCHSEVNLDVASECSRTSNTVRHPPPSLENLEEPDVKNATVRSSRLPHGGAAEPRSKQWDTKSPRSGSARHSSLSTAATCFCTTPANCGRTFSTAHSGSAWTPQSFARQSSWEPFWERCKACHKSLIKNTDNPEGKERLNAAGPKRLGGGSSWRPKRPASSQQISFGEVVVGKQLPRPFSAVALRGNKKSSVPSQSRVPDSEGFKPFMQTRRFEVKCKNNHAKTTPDEWYASHPKAQSSRNKITTSLQTLGQAADVPHEGDLESPAPAPVRRDKPSHPPEQGDNSSVPFPANGTGATKQPALAAAVGAEPSDTETLSLKDAPLFSPGRKWELDFFVNKVAAVADKDPEPSSATRSTFTPSRNAQSAAALSVHADRPRNSSALVNRRCGGSQTALPVQKTKCPPADTFLTLNEEVRPAGTFGIADAWATPYRTGREFLQPLLRRPPDTDPKPGDEAKEPGNGDTRKKTRGPLLLEIKRAPPYIAETPKLDNNVKISRAPNTMVLMGKPARISVPAGINYSFLPYRRHAAAADLEPVSVLAARINDHKLQEATLGQPHFRSPKRNEDRVIKSCRTENNQNPKSGDVFDAHAAQTKNAVSTCDDLGRLLLRRVQCIRNPGVFMIRGTKKKFSSKAESAAKPATSKTPKPVHTDVSAQSKSAGESRRHRSAQRDTSGSPSKRATKKNLRVANPPSNPVSSARKMSRRFSQVAADKPGRQSAAARRDASAQDTSLAVDAVHDLTEMPDMDRAPPARPDAAKAEKCRAVDDKKEVARRDTSRAVGAGYRATRTRTNCAGDVEKGATKRDVHRYRNYALYNDFYETKMERIFGSEPAAAVAGSDSSTSKSEEYDDEGEDKDDKKKEVDEDIKQKAGIEDVEQKAEVEYVGEKKEDENVGQKKKDEDVEGKEEDSTEVNDEEKNEVHSEDRDNEAQEQYEKLVKPLSAAMMKEYCQKLKLQGDGSVTLTKAIFRWNNCMYDKFSRVSRHSCKGTKS